MEMNLIIKYLEKEPDILTDIYNIMKYRNLRTEQIYYAKLAHEYDHVDLIKQCKEVRGAGALARGSWGTNIERLDRKRREVHNTALISFNSIMKVGEQNNLEKIFDGKRLTDDEIIKYENAERRADLTDSMFEMLYEIEDSIIDREENSQTHDYIRNIKQDMRTFNKDYKVSKSILKDESIEKDGGIEFDLAILFDNNDSSTESL